jgi:viroplasmin and RNaseH domain-containing protein
MIWYVVFRGQKPGVYDSWGVCSEYVLHFSGATYHSYFIKLEVEETYVAFLKQQNKDRKPEHVVKLWYWKDLMILVQFIVSVVLWCQIM